MKQTSFIILLLFTLYVSAQDNRERIHGFISNDSIALENIHVVNKTTNRGTLSNNKGEFEILVKENDTIQFSGIQFITKRILITRQQMQNRELKIYLPQKTNVLQEVVVQNMAKSLGLPNAGKKPLNKLERNLNRFSQKSTPIVILEALLFKPGGIDDVYNIISGNRKKDRKLKKLIDEDNRSLLNQENIESIRNHFGDDYFINTLKIPKENIEGLIHYCLPKGIVFVFERERYLEVVDLLLKNKESYITSLR